MFFMGIFYESLHPNAKNYDAGHAVIRIIKWSLNNEFC
ncbi:hypothetical protein CIP106467_2539 [Citrobacter europaeus]|nr:hypothetical protein CIP106467_2539 [Citrobacter europaeus]